MIEIDGSNGQPLIKLLNMKCSERQKSKIFERLIKKQSNHGFAGVKQA